MLLRDITPEPLSDTQIEDGPDWDLEALVEQIWDEIGGAESRTDITQALMDVLPAYEDASVKTFIPIFARRRVLNRLQGRATENPASTPHDQ